MDKLKTIIDIFTGLIADLSGRIAKAIQAATTNDQAALDALHAEAIAAADALKPSGA